MKISAHFAAKRPSPLEKFSSDCFALTIEGEPPPDVAQDRGRLREYVARLFDECRQRVDEQMTAAVEPAASNGRSNGHIGVNRQSGARSSAIGRHNGQNGSSNGSVATPRQINFLNSIAREAGLGYRGLDELAHTQFGKSTSELTKREASQLIDELKG